MPAMLPVELLWCAPIRTEPDARPRLARGSFESARIHEAVQIIPFIR